MMEKIHKMDRLSAILGPMGQNITVCGIVGTGTTFDRHTYMDVFGSEFYANRTWEGVTCRQCLKMSQTNVNSVCSGRPYD